MSEFTRLGIDLYNLVEAYRAKLPAGDLEDLARDVGLRVRALAPGTKVAAKLMFGLDIAGVCHALHRVESAQATPIDWAAIESAGGTVRTMAMMDEDEPREAHAFSPLGLRERMALERQDVTPAGREITATAAEHERGQPDAATAPAKEPHLTPAQAIAMLRLADGADGYKVYGRLLGTLPKADVQHKGNMRLVKVESWQRLCDGLNAASASKKNWSDAIDVETEKAKIRQQNGARKRGE